MCYNHLPSKLLLLCLLALGACATYYQKQEAFNTLLYKGDLAKADEVLAKDKKGPQSRNRFLYNVNRGTVNWMLGKTTESNQFFQAADLIAEDYRKSNTDVAAGLLVNPMLAEYKPEDFEAVLLHYYKTINWLNAGNYENAMVECRRMNIQLNEINDKYPAKRKNRYKSDAFGYTLMGLTYDAAGEYNNAFISYRNAIETYENLYDTLFLVKVPLQLKKDLIRSAYRSGFRTDGEFYEKKYGIKYEEVSKEQGELVFFWNNGFGPVKGESSINFTILPGENGLVTFVNEELALNFAFYLPAAERNKQSALADLKFMRIAFPKYIERPLYYAGATLSRNGKDVRPLELAENVNSIAFQCLKDRMLRELGQSLLRLASKKAVEYAARSQNQDLGAVVGIANALTEKADTRNWQTLPYAIYYTRMALPTGQQSVQLSTKGRGSQTHSFSYNIQAGKTVFQGFQSLETGMNMPYGVR